MSYNWGMAENKLLSVSFCRFVFQWQVKTPKLPIQNLREPWGATALPRAIHTTVPQGTDQALSDSAQSMKSTQKQLHELPQSHCQQPQVPITNHPRAKQLMVPLGSKPAGLEPASLYGTAWSFFNDPNRISNTLTPATFLKPITSAWQRKYFQYGNWYIMCFQYDKY